MLLCKSVDEVKFLREDMSSMFHDVVDSHLLAGRDKGKYAVRGRQESKPFDADQKTGDIFEAATIDCSWTMFGGLK